MHDTKDLLPHTTAIVCAALAAGRVSTAGDIPALIESTYRALSATLAPAPTAPAGPTPAVAIDKSIQRQHLICLEDGKKVKMLKRYLRRFNLTPEQYREKWGLPRNYPMVAAEYSSRRRDLAKRAGLGRKAG